MPNIENAKEHFYRIMSEKINNGFMKETSNISSPNSGFYELCKYYAEIGLNAPKRPAEKDLNIEAIFQYGDLDKAVEETQTFISKHNVADIDELLDCIKAMHSYAIEKDDTRPKSTVQWVCTNWNKSRFGSYTIFSKLPDDLFEDIVEAVKTGVKRWYY